MARKRLTELRFPKDVIADVSRLVELHLRFHGYGEGEWTDSAVRRYVTDAGPLLTRLHALTRADCTTRNARKAARLAAAYDGLEERIEELRKQEEIDAIRPEIDGNEIMELLGLPPGPLVGKARKFVLDLRMEQGMLGRDRVITELLDWAETEGIPVPPRPASARAPAPRTRRHLPGSTPQSSGPRDMTSRWPAGRARRPRARPRR
jgi:poly(A) polymerase